MAGHALYTTKCPHCWTENAGFTSVAQVKTDTVQAGSLWNVFLACNGCHGGIIAVTSSGGSYGPHGLPSDVSIPGRGVSQQGLVTSFHVQKSYPSPRSHQAPDHVPDRIAATYIEASENLHRRKFETSQMLCRKALDLATKQLLPDSKKSLYHRIEELKDTGKITVEMSEWAHIVRDDGNGSVHDDSEATQKSASELLAFTETFLMYAFTLPGMIAQRRQEEGPPEDQE